MSFTSGADWMSFSATCSGSASSITRTASASVESALLSSCSTTSSVESVPLSAEAITSGEASSKTTRRPLEKAMSCSAA